MLRVKVQSCKWECLLCLRTFTSKFCYLLHCKNVHGKTSNNGDALTNDEPDIRPISSEETPANQNQAAATIAANSDKASDKIALEDALQCTVCKKVLSCKSRLRQHKALHLKGGLKKKSAKIGKQMSRPSNLTNADGPSPTSSPISISVEDPELQGYLAFCFCSISLFINPLTTKNYNAD